MPPWVIERRGSALWVDRGMEFYAAQANSKPSQEIGGTTTGGKVQKTRLI